MQTTPFDRFSRHTASALISGYQRHISPKKGFSCAHRVLHGGESCSEYIKRTILEQGLLRTIPLSRKRFQACKAANRVLRVRRKIWLQMQAEDMDNEEPESEGKAKPRKTIQNGNFRHYRASNPGSNQTSCSDMSCPDIDCPGCIHLAVDVVSNVPDCSGADCIGLSCDFGSCG